MQRQFCGFGSAIWDQPLFLNLNQHTIFRSDGDRIEDFFTRCLFHRFFHIEPPEAPLKRDFRCVSTRCGECARPVESSNFNRASG